MDQKEIKSPFSVKSRRSNKSLTSTYTNSTTERRSFFDTNEEMFMNFNEYLQIICIKFMCPTPVKVIKKYLNTARDDIIKIRPSDKLKSKTISFGAATLATSQNDVKTDDNRIVSPLAVTESEALHHGVYVMAYYDALNRLAEIYMHNLQTMPRKLMQCIGLLAPHYQNLTKFAIQDSKINVYTIYELSKMLSNSWITDICLDGCPLLEGNYAILLSKSQLKNLSLCRCLINDDVCKNLSEKLKFPHAAETKLHILNLSSNRITDVGISYLSEALRSNTHLRYLNLSANLIHDEGASNLFNILGEFPLTYEEIMGKRYRYMEYLKARHAIRLKYINDYETRSIDENSRISKKKAKSTPLLKRKSASKKDDGANVKAFKSNIDEVVTVKADILAGEIMGPFNDPFCRFATLIKNGYIYSKGNFTLCYLNLAYNNLSLVSVKKLAAILKYQDKVMSFHEAGLFVVNLDGNMLPNISDELSTVNDLLIKKIMAHSKFFAPMTRKGRRSTIIAKQ